MYRITDVTHNRGVFTVSVEPDGYLQVAEKTKYRVAKELFDAEALVSGALIGDAEFDALEEAAALTRAIAISLDVISRSNVSRKALTDKLRLKYGITPDLADKAAEYAAERRYIAEEAQACEIARRAVSSKLWGKRRIIADLSAKGYPPACCRNAASTIPDEEYSRALALLVRKRGFSRLVPGTKQHASAVGSLMRFGYESSDIRRALGSDDEQDY